jgi:hypothetical protein
MNDRGRAGRGLALPSENNADAPRLFDHLNGISLRAQRGRGPS